MAVERTLAILKPDCVRKNLTGKVIAFIQDNGFRIVSLKMMRFTTATAEKFYDIHREQPFFKPLIGFMVSGPSVVMVLEKDNAVKDFRLLMGATDPAKAAEGTIRKLFADNNRENIVHGSDCEDNSCVEICYFFTSAELLNLQHT